MINVFNFKHLKLSKSFDLIGRGKVITLILNI